MAWLLTVKMERLFKLIQDTEIEEGLFKLITEKYRREHEAFTEFHFGLSTKEYSDISLYNSKVKAPKIK